jgi:pimeloyl-ACP methyl ester carboxylesterase
MNRKLAIIATFILIILSACGGQQRTIQPTPRPTAPFGDISAVSGEKVQFTTSDGFTLQGTLYGSGSVGVILAHMGLGSTAQASWQPFAKEISQLGYTALTFDFRGRGSSQGPLDEANLSLDVNAAVAFLRERGIEKIVCIGASMGGSACLRAVLDNHLDGLVVIASPFSLGAPTNTSPAELEALTIPTLFITANKDRYANEMELKVMLSKVSGPSEMVVYDGAAQHGTDLFYSDYGTEFNDKLISYLAGIQP